MLGLMMRLIDFILHIDVHLAKVIAAYGGLTYGILFLIVFCETGLVVTPILPGDTLLFTAGALSSTEGARLNVHFVFCLLSIAAVLGDTVNYWIGHKVGPAVFKRKGSRLFNRKHLERTHAFYEKYGGKTIILARFVPIIRTFAPFVAGIGAMTYGRFLAYNVIGGVLWISSLVYAGYLFGNIPWVKDNLTLLVIGIVVVSLIPAVTTFVREHGRRQD